ncbi:HNH endonuclease [Micromonospora sp. NPDC048935]|uniref:HNH endonuclease n=1 Tax=Micromonospora sp. NPDC048935 TaxID=3364262 RepID=UPI00371599DB
MIRATPPQAARQASDVLELSTSTGDSVAVSRTLRFQILRRDSHRCQSCGRSAPEVQLEVDHVLPEALGGPSTPENLRALCADCNGGKSATPPDAAVVAQVSADAVRWAEAQKAAAHRMLANLDAQARNRAEFDEAWQRWTYGGDRTFPRDDDWMDSVSRLVAAGLPMPVLLDCVDQAMRNKTIPVDRIFRYMCGIAWRRVKDLHEAAAAMLDDARSGSSERDSGSPMLARAVLEWAVGEQDALRREALDEATEDGVDNPSEAELLDRAAVISARNAWSEVTGHRNAATSLLAALPEPFRRLLLERAERDVAFVSDEPYSIQDVEAWAVVIVGREISERFAEHDWSQGKGGEVSQ